MPTKQQKDIDIRLKALDFASRNKPSDFGGYTSTGTFPKGTYNLVVEAKLIEKYIKSGE